MSFWCCCGSIPSESSRPSHSGSSDPPNPRVPCFPCSSPDVATEFNSTASIGVVSYNGNKDFGDLDGTELTFDFDGSEYYTPPICQVTYVKDFSGPDGNLSSGADFVDVRVFWKIEYWRQELPYFWDDWPQTDIIVFVRTYPKEFADPNVFVSTQFALRPVWVKFHYDYECDENRMLVSTTQTLVNIFNSAEKLEVTLTNDV